MVSKMVSKKEEPETQERRKHLQSNKKAYLNLPWGMILWTCPEMKKHYRGKGHKVLIGEQEP